MSVQLDLFVRLLDMMPVPVHVYDCNGRPIHATPALQQLLVTDRESWRLDAAFTELVRHVLGRDGGRRTVCIGANEYHLYAASVGAAVAGCDVVVIAAHQIQQPRISDTDLRDRFRLTPREIDIAHLIAAGLPNDEIAAKLDRSRFTVRRHTERILAKLDVRRRAQVGVRLAGV